MIEDRVTKTIEIRTNNFIISLQRTVYNFNIDLIDDSIVIKAKSLKENNLFERNFQLPILQANNKYFNFFNISEIFKLIKKKINSQSISIKNLDYCLILTLIFDFDGSKTKIDLSIPRILNENYSSDTDGFSRVFVELLEKFKNFENVFYENSKIIRNDEIILLSRFIGLNPENIILNRIYRGTEDGDNPENFHQKCDLKYPTITVIEALNGQRFGGYTAVPWDSSNNWKNDIRAFIFSLSRKKKLKPKDDIKSIYCDKNHFATFGSGHDIFISNNYFSSSSSYSKLVTYEDNINRGDIKKEHFLAGGYNFIIKEMEVFQVNDIN